MSWLGAILGSNVLTAAAARIGIPGIGGAKGEPNLVNSGIGVPYPKKEGQEEKNGMRMQRIAAAGAAKPKPNDAIAKQFGI